jgi:hypothetical protein
VTGKSPRKTTGAPCRKSLPAIASRSGKAGKHVRPVEHINEEIQDVIPRSLAGRIEIPALIIWRLSQPKHHFIFRFAIAGMNTYYR